jgi:hypothetical protein
MGWSNTPLQTLNVPYSLKMARHTSNSETNATKALGWRQNHVAVLAGLFYSRWSFLSN